MQESGLVFFDQLLKLPQELAREYDPVFPLRHVLLALVNSFVELKAYGGFLEEMFLVAGEPRLQHAGISAEEKELLGVALSILRNEKSGRLRRGHLHDITLLEVDALVQIFGLH